MRRYAGSFTRIEPPFCIRVYSPMPYCQATIASLCALQPTVRAEEVFPELVPPEITIFSGEPPPPSNRRFATLSIRRQRPLFVHQGRTKEPHAPARDKLQRLAMPLLEYWIRHGAIVHAPTERFCCSSLEAGRVGGLTCPTWPP
jgi:hypothetical protein